jgi:hypothetical protein
MSSIGAWRVAARSIVFVEHRRLRVGTIRSQNVGGSRGDSDTGTLLHCGVQIDVQTRDQSTFHRICGAT